MKRVAKRREKNSFRLSAFGGSRKYFFFFKLISSFSIASKMYFFYREEIFYNMIIRRAAERHTKTLFHLPELKLDCRHLSQRSLVGVVKRRKIYLEVGKSSMYITCWYSLFCVRTTTLCYRCVYTRSQAFLLLVEFSTLLIIHILSALSGGKQSSWALLKLTDNLIGAVNCFGISTWLFIQRLSLGMLIKLFALIIKSKLLLAARSLRLLATFR